MRRGSKIAVVVTASLTALAVASGTTYAVLSLDDVTETTSRVDARVASPGQPDVADSPIVAAKPKPQSQPQPQPQPQPKPKPQPKPAPAPAPEPAPLFERGDEGAEVRELQSRLKQLAWYAPDITGTYDPVTEQAVRGFQGKRGFEITGAVDRRTWQRVVSMSRMPTTDEMHNRLTPGPTILGPGDSSSEVRDLQARLQQIGWFSPDVTDYYSDTTTEAVSGFQVKREIPSTGAVDQRTLDRLLEMTSEPTKDELLNRKPERKPKPDRAPAAMASEPTLDPRCLTGRVLCIDKSSNSLRWVIDGSVQTTVDVRFGSDELPTDEGKFAVALKSRDHVSSLYNTPMPFAMFFSGGQAVHYSPDFAATGYNGASHGCVNVRDYGAIRSLFDQVNVGDTVIVYWS